MLLSALSPRDNTIYSWNLHSSGVHKRRLGTQTQAESQLEPGDSPGTISSHRKSGHSAVIKGQAGPPQAGEWDVAIFWRFKIPFWENIHRSGLGWALMAEKHTEVLLVLQAMPGTEEAMDTFIPSQGTH